MAQQTDAQIIELINSAYEGGADRVEWEAELKVLIRNIVDSKPNKEDTNFTVFTGTAWDGSNKFYTPSANMVFTISSTKAMGVFNIKSNSSYTLSFNGTNIPINTTGKTSVGFMKVDGEYWFLDKDGNIVVVASGSGDVTAPTVVSATAINATTIRLVFSETMGVVTTAGHSLKQNGTPITPDSVSGAGTTWDFVFSETFVSGDTFLRSYDSGTGATTDVATNELASYTDQSVTNGIAGPVTYVTDNFSGGNDSDIAGRSTITGGGTWTASGANTGLIKIESGVARLNTTMLIAKYYITGTIRNLNTRVTLGTSGADVYMLLAYTDENNYIQVNAQTGNTFEIVAGVATSLMFIETDHYKQQTAL
jgi:hypothetical protein